MSPKEMMEALAQPFPADVVGWKAQVVRDNRALAVAYIDARDVENRLDSVFGIDGWQDSYQVLPNNSVVCTLRVKVNGEWITRCDVGSQSEQPDEGDRLKAAFSDALKRAAVKYGVGRYLYSLPQSWCEYDAKTRQIKQPPQLPAKFLPQAPNTNGATKKEDAFITREQWDEIKANLVKRDIPQRELLARFQVRKPGELTVPMFKEALALSQQPFSEWQAV